MILRKLQGFFFRVNIISKVTVIGKVLKNTAQWPVNVGERFLWTLQCRPTRCKAFLDLQALAKIKESYGKNQRKWDWKGPAQCTCSTPGLDGSRPDAAAGVGTNAAGRSGGLAVRFCSAVSHARGSCCFLPALWLSLVLPSIAEEDFSTGLPRRRWTSFVQSSLYRDVFEFGGAQWFISQRLCLRCEHFPFVSLLFNNLIVQLSKHRCLVPLTFFFFLGKGDFIMSCNF